MENQTKELSPAQIALLKSRLPKEAVKQHPTKTYLSTIKAIYVIERLNTVFGIGKWTQISKIISSEKGVIVVDSSLSIPEYGILLHSFGGNDNGGENSKGFDLGDAYKGACTDAMTKMCSFLEIGIDVFKGLMTAPQEPAAKQPVKPELKAGTEPYEKALKFMSDGGDITKIEAKYTISPNVRTALLNPSI